MKKLLFISNICRGVSNFHIVSATASENVGYEFHFAANFTNLSKDMEANYPNIHFHHIDFIRFPFHPRNVKAYIELKKLIQEIRPDAIHCNTPIGGALGRLCGYKCHVKKIIYTAHGFHFYKGAKGFSNIIYKKAETALAKMTDAIITMNKEDFQAASQMKMRGINQTYKVHGVGINVKEYMHNQLLRERKRQQLGVGKEDFICIAMGDLIRRKNYETSLKAIAKIKNSHIHFLICGDGNKKKDLLVLSQKLGISEQIHFLGYRNDIKELLQAADCFLFSTLQEGLPRSLMEAMASGLPCIVSNIRGNVDLIKNGFNGILCDPKDEEAFAKAILDLYVNKGKRLEMGKRNLDIIQEYDVDNVIEEMEKIYSQVLAV